jgi:hypothetical protein
VFRLSRRDHPGLRPGVPLPDRPRVDAVRVLEPEAAVRGRVRQQRHRRRLHVVDDLRESPFPAGPRLREVPAALVDRVAAAAAQLRGLHLDGGREPRRGGLREDARTRVVVLVRPRRRVDVEDRVHHHARLPLREHLRRHVAPQLVHRGDDQWVHVRLHRIGVGREEDPGAGAPHLVHVVDDVGPPRVVRLLHRELRLALGEGVPVTIVVVTDVVVVQRREPGTLELRPHPPAVPIGDHLRTVGVQRRDVQEHHLVQDLPHARVVGRGEAVEEIRGHLPRPHLRGVDVLRGEHHGAAALEQILALRLVADAARVGELLLDLPELREPRMVLGAGDDQHHERPTERGGPQRVDADAGAGASHQVVVGAQLRPVGQLPVGAGAIAEMRLRRGYAREHRRGALRVERGRERSDGPETRREREERCSSDHQRAHDHRCSDAVRGKEMKRNAATDMGRRGIIAGNVLSPQTRRARLQFRRSGWWRISAASTSWP